MLSGDLEGVPFLPFKMASLRHRQGLEGEEGIPRCLSTPHFLQEAFLDSSRWWDTPSDILCWTATCPGLGPLILMDPGRESGLACWGPDPQHSAPHGRAPAWVRLCPEGARQQEQSVNFKRLCLTSVSLGEGGKGAGGGGGGVSLCSPTTGLGFTAPLNAVFARTPPGGLYAPVHGRL